MQKQYFAVMKVSVNGDDYACLFNTLYRTHEEADAAIVEALRDQDEDSDDFEYYIETVQLPE